MATSCEIRVFDGVAFAIAGDVTLAIYSLPARLARSRWLFDCLDEATGQSDDTMVGFLVILPSADLPDAETRGENERRLRTLQGKLRRVVTVALGGGLRLNLVRTVMRGMFVLQRRSHEQFVASTLDEGLRHVLRDATPRTPTRVAIETTLQAMFTQLGCTPMRT